MVLYMSFTGLNGYKYKALDGFCKDFTRVLYGFHGDVGFGVGGFKGEA